MLVCFAYIGITQGAGCNTSHTNLLALQNKLQQALDEITTLLPGDSEPKNESGNRGLPRDCQDIKYLGHRKTGVYTIYPVLAPFGFQVLFNVFATKMYFHNLLCLFRVSLIFCMSRWNNSKQSGYR